jgi:hypothetical protein
MTPSATRNLRIHKHRVSTLDGEESKKPPGSEQEFLDILIRDVVNATAFENRANEEFNARINQFPSGLPYPDEAQQINIASAHLSSARTMLEIARIRLANFINSGTVPEDLKPSG